MKMDSHRVEFLDGIMKGESHVLPCSIKTVTLYDDVTTYTIIGDYAMTEPNDWVEWVTYRQTYGMEFMELAGPGIIMGEMQRVLYDQAKAIPGTTIWTFDTDWDANLQTVEARAYAYKEGIE